MNKVAITFDNRLLANAFAMWLEDGECLEAFKDYARKVNISPPNYADVEYDGGGDDDNDADHTVIIR